MTTFGDGGDACGPVPRVTSWSGRRLHRRVGGERGDRAQHPLAVAEQHAELFEVDLGQLGQNLRVDRVFAKDRFILRQVETAQPRRNVHGLPGGLLFLNAQLNPIVKTSKGGTDAGHDLPQSAV